MLVVLTHQISRSGLQLTEPFVEYADIFLLFELLVLLLQFLHFVLHLFIEL